MYLTNVCVECAKLPNSQYLSTACTGFLLERWGLARILGAACRAARRARAQWRGGKGSRVCTKCQK
eukprot:gene17090-biopygen20342